MSRPTLPPVEPLLLSKRRAAKLLGIGRGKMLERLIREGHIRPVVILGEQKIPRAELDRLVREGTEPAPDYVPKAPAQTVAKSSRGKKRGPRPGDDIRALKF
jgi:hypothetical protein